MCLALRKARVCNDIVYKYLTLYLTLDATLRNCSFKATIIYVSFIIFASINTALVQVFTANFKELI